LQKSTFKKSTAKKYRTTFIMAEAKWASTEHGDLYRLFWAKLGWQGPAKTITPLSAMLPMDYGQVERLILHLSLQMQVLAEQHKGLGGFTLEDITVLDGEFYFLSGLDQVMSIKNMVLTFTYPIKFNEELLAPELREKLVPKVLPFTTALSVGYYSLAKLGLLCLGLTDNLEALRGSKMYYCFERCLRVDPAERVFLYF